MEFSVRKRIGMILENTQRVQELAGINPQYSASDPEAGMVAPPNAYEDTYDGLIKRFGDDILEKIQMFVESQMNEQLVQTGIDGADIKLKKSPSPNPSNSVDGNIKKATDIFIRFGGYMSDAKNYVFNVGYKNVVGEEVFAYRFVMDIEGKLGNWQSVNFGS